MTRVRLPLLTEVSEYQGQASIAVNCTQLGTDYTASRAKRIVDEWIEFFTNPTELTSVEFRSRTPKRLFAALAGQPQLTRLSVKWGDYADLTPLAGMRGLRQLELRGASAVTNVEPLSGLPDLRFLALEGFKTIEDPSPLATLRSLTELELGGAWMASRIGHVSTISFLRELTPLETLLLHTLIVDDLDYNPLLALPRLGSVRVMKVRGMQPPFDELRRRLPWSE